MERLHCSAADAEKQLTDLAAGAHVSVAELASEITGAASSGPATEATSGASDAGGLTWVSARAAPDVAGIARALLDEGLTAEGVRAVAIWLLVPDGGIELGGEAGFGPGEAARWRRVPPGFRTPAARSVRDGAELWWPRGRPSGEDLPLIGGRSSGARAVLPLEKRGLSIGALELCWPSPIEEFGALTRRHLRALGEICSQAITAGGDVMAADYSAAWIQGLLSGLHESVLIARPASAGHSAAGAQTGGSAGGPGSADGPPGGLVIEWASEGFTDPAGRGTSEVVGHPLLEIYPEAARQGGLYDCALRVIATGQPEHLPNVVLATAGAFTAEVRIAPFCDGVAITWRAAGESDRLAALLDLAERLGRIGSWQEDRVTGDVLWTDHAFELLNRPHGRPVRLDGLDKHVLADDGPAVAAFRDRVLRQHEAATAAFGVIRPDDGTVRQLRAVAEPVTGPDGELIAVRGAYQDISPQLHTQIAFDATREQLTDAQQLAAEERRLAIRLQQAITPQASQLVGSAGLDVAARYRPAESDSLVSGDWYDAVVLPGKQVLIAVGDVAGHGLDAVTGMVALRNYLRGLAVTGAGPAQLLGWLNGAACELADGLFATAICALYDPVSRVLRWARAGHLPPLLVRDGTADLLPLPSGVVLGADSASGYSEAEVSLLPGDVLLLFTDGLVESRVVPLDQSLAELRQRASQRVEDVGRFADEIMASSTSDTGDDACLLAVSIR